MEFQLLVSTMNQKDCRLIEKMNIRSDAIIINQCNNNKFENLKYKGYTIKFVSLAERGVGLSRNTALMRATANICLFSDDDVEYVEGYKDIICKIFEDDPKADVFIFNVPSMNPERPSFEILEKKRVKLYNCLKYGAVRIAIRTEKLKKSNIYFSLLFGGGAKYSAGEDSLFIADCIRKGLKVYTHPQIIGYVDQKSSSWFEGYTDKYFFDKGVFFACLSRRMAHLLALQYIIRYNKKWREYITMRKAYKLMFQGIKEVK